MNRQEAVDRLKNEVKRIEEIMENGDYGCVDMDTWNEFAKKAEWRETLIELLTGPTPDPNTGLVPVVRGEWIVDECDTADDVPSYSWIEFHCSECNTNYGLEEGQYSWCRYEKIPYNYCPNCGAKMEGRQ